MGETRTMMNYAAARSSRVVVTRGGSTLATLTIPKGAFCMVSVAGKWQRSGQPPDRFVGDVDVRAIPAAEMAEGEAFLNAWTRAPIRLGLTNVEVEVHHE